MATCPAGHDSSDEEYCDTCGIQMTGTAAPPAPAIPAQGGGEQAGGCPDCGAPRGGRFCESCGYDFVLGGPGASSRSTRPPAATPSGPVSGASQGTGSPSWQPAQVVRPGSAQVPASRPAPPPPPPPPAAGGWVVVIGADRGHYDAMISQGGPDAAMVAFPPYCPERRVALSGPEMRVGRRSRTRSLLPEIDLSGPPEDPGVSHLHAVFLAQPDGTWQLVDPGSANGTLLNGKAVEVNHPLPLSDGDRVHVGAWTVITVRRA
ncbi:FHA domain-containing protein [Sphaerisporangium aureirubrum]|uniref:FHA domain-containing protein n=1 Tax=Sphaerisporangium aureirubrum TaxID=1544736 RepID=A0ABW1NH47_9ACTN